MATFFFLVGLEIKREILVGELLSRDQAALPLAAAIRGMIVPAVLFSAFNFGEDGQCGSIDVFEQAGLPEDNIFPNKRQRGALRSLETAVHHAETPLQRLEHTMHPWVLFVIMPLFVLANARLNRNRDARLSQVLTGLTTVKGFILARTNTIRHEEDGSAR